MCVRYEPHTARGGGGGKGVPYFVHQSSSCLEAVAVVSVYIAVFSEIMSWSETTQPHENAVDQNNLMATNEMTIQQNIFGNFRETIFTDML